MLINAAHNSRAQSMTIPSEATLVLLPLFNKAQASCDAQPQLPPSQTPRLQKRNLVKNHLFLPDLNLSSSNFFVSCAARQPTCCTVSQHRMQTLACVPAGNLAVDKVLLAYLSSIHLLRAVLHCLGSHHAFQVDVQRVPCWHQVLVVDNLDEGLNTTTKLRRQVPASLL